MTKTLTQEWLTKQAHTVLHMMPRLQKRTRNQDLHDLRVAFKAIKAIVQHQQNGSMQFRDEFPCLIRFFKLAGKLRDTNQIRAKMGTLPAYPAKGKADKLLKNQGKNAASQLRHFLANGEAKASIAIELHQLESLQPHQLEFSGAIRQLSGTTLPEQKNDWHDWRKKLKDLHYLKTAEGLDEENMDRSILELQHAIGEWHDWSNAGSWLIAHEHVFKPADFYLLQQQISMKTSAWEETVTQLNQDFIR